jgi:hypothetical protein
VFEVEIKKCYVWESAGRLGWSGVQGDWERQEAKPRGERKDMCSLSSTATEHINQIEHELNKCIRKPNGDNFGTAYRIQPTTRQQKRKKRTQKEQRDVIRYAEFQAKKK